MKVASYYVKYTQYNIFDDGIDVCVKDGQDIYVILRIGIKKSWGSDALLVYICVRGNYSYVRWMKSKKLPRNRLAKLIKKCLNFEDLQQVDKYKASVAYLDTWHYATQRNWFKEHRNLYRKILNDFYINISEIAKLSLYYHLKYHNLNTIEKYRIYFQAPILKTLNSAMLKALKENDRQLFFVDRSDN